jgi:hypothetical protein
MNQPEMYKAAVVATALAMPVLAPSGPRLVGWSPRSSKTAKQKAHTKRRNQIARKSRRQNRGK